ncbi:MAG: hypothetical protein KAW47_07615, partial [Thermoplasmatales archaeon]|nr:hypothetical protein [Thermoplasmatales archaeon]
VLVRAIKFSDTATWHIVQPEPVEQFQWPDLEASGSGRAMGEALRLVAEALKVEKMGKRGLCPVLALVSDGQPTDDFKGGLKQLMQEPWGKKAVRIAIAIGKDADRDVLQQFVGREYGLLEANNLEAIKKIINGAFMPTPVIIKPPSVPRYSSYPKGIIENDVW